jgi:ABC-type phosphate transport system substrate-binding protein
MTLRPLARLSILALSLTATGAAAELVVVVNPKNPTATLTERQVAQIFLGRTGSFPSGSAATPLDLKEGSALRDEFYVKVTEKNAGQLKAYRAKQLFSGSGSPPRELGTPLEVRRAVASDPTAIGYIDRAALDGSVKEILTVR